MRIDRIELFHVAMPLIYPWRTAYGEDAAIHAVLCRMTSGSVAAWGESSPAGRTLLQPRVGGRRVCRRPRLAGPGARGTQTFAAVDELQQRIRLFKGNPFAKAVLDSAWWSLASKFENRPLHELLGASRCEVPVGADFGVMDSVDELLRGVGQAVQDGFPRIKLKFRPGWDVAMLAAVRKQHPNQTIHIDCNSGYTLDDLSLFQRIDEFQLAMIEQPLPHDDVVEHAQLQAAIRTPVCLDESITSPRHARLALQLRSCQYVNIKPGRVGGLTNAVAIHDLCRSAGIPCWVGGMLESATARRTAWRWRCSIISSIRPIFFPALASTTKTCPIHHSFYTEMPPAFR